MRHISTLSHAFILICLAPYKALGASLKSGTFKISDNGVQGQGTYSLNNGTAEIGLNLIIGIASSPIKDKATATIKSLPPDRLGTSSPSDKATATITSLPPGPSGPPAPNGPGPSGPSPNVPNPSGIPVTSEAGNPSQALGVILTPEDNQFIDNMVAIHNELRSVHFSPPIQNNTNMSIAAKKLALELAMEKDLRHSSPSERPQEGESLAMGCTTADGYGITAREAITKWYEEACCHNFSIHGFQNMSGHFSQLVWKATEEIGVGRAFGTKWGMNCTFIVARYKPKGNIDSEFVFKENVERGTFDAATYNCSAVVDCSSRSVAAAETQVRDSRVNNQQDSKISDKSRNVSYQNEISQIKEPQRYNLNGKSSQQLNNAMDYRGPHGYVTAPGYNSRQLGARYQVGRRNQYDRDQSPQRYIPNGVSEGAGRPRFLAYRAKIPHIPGIKVL